MYDKLEEVAARYDELTAILSDPEIFKRAWRKTTYCRNFFKIKRSKAVIRRCL